MLLPKMTFIVKNQDKGYLHKLMNVYWEKIDRQAPSSDRRHDRSYG